MDEEVTRAEQLADALQKQDLDEGVRVRVRMPDGRSRFAPLPLPDWPGSA
jgi:hypothetical protein